jgi:hypothetical protein
VKFVRVVAVGILCLASSALVAQAGAGKSFDRLKALAGTWQGTTDMGQSVTVSYRLTANGSAVMSETQSHDEDMITMFHLDGDRLLMTHYCGAGNQPHMKAVASSDATTIAFEVTDVTNLNKSQRGHMRALNLKFLDDAHHTEEWVFQNQDGKEMRDVLNLKRVQ